MPHVISPSEQCGPPLSCASAAYDGRPGTIAAARDFAAGFLAETQAAGGAAVTAQTVGVVRLVVSELVTNALKHAPGPCWLDLDITGDTLRITAWDTGSALPAVLPHDAGRVGQHGLEIVVALCRRLEIEQQTAGKRIRAYVAL
ncbi:ATP-binding protein [Streptomyces sp. NPDC002055]|uniref:ATP-binding protein n=1 Tax=Streptomyces sp. NPDC002055 TaxID=3154534 RepID=UPI0033335397